MTYSKERYNPAPAPPAAGLIAWCVKQFQAIQRAMPWAPHADTRDFVTVAEGADASAQFTNAVNAIGVGSLFIAPRIYRFASNITIPSGTLIRPATGALLQPQSGVTVTITGPVDAVAWQWMDFSGGGSFSFTGNTDITYFYAKWFGVVGDGATNDTPNLVNVVRSVPDSSSVLFTAGMEMMLDTTWTWNNRAGLRFFSEIEPRPNGSLPAPRFLWNGPISLQLADGAMSSVTNPTTLTSATGGFTNAHVGEQVIVYGAGTPGTAPHLRTTIQSVTNSTTAILALPAVTTVTGARVAVGGVMLYADRSLHCLFQRLHFELDDALGVRHPANVAIDLDGYGGGQYGFGSACEIEYCNVHGNKPNSFVEVFRASETVLFNHEYHKFKNNKAFSGAVLQRFFNTASITSGSHAVATTNSVFFFNPTIGMRVRIPNGLGAGVPLDTTITAVADQQHATMAAAAGNTLTNVDIVMGQGTGTMLKVGGSFNAKGLVFNDNEGVGFNNVVNQLNGSLRAARNNIPANEVNYNFVEGSEPFYVEMDNSETSLQGVSATCHQPVSILGCRFDPTCTKPNGGYIHTGQNFPLTMRGCTVDAGLPSTSTFFDLHASTAVEFSFNVVSQYTMAQLGLDDATIGYPSNTNLFGGTVVGMGNTGITDQPGVNWIKNTNLYLSSLMDANTGDALPAVTIKVIPGNASAEASGVLAQLTRTGNNITVSGLRAELGRIGSFGGGTHMGLHVAPYLPGGGASMNAYEGMVVESPSGSGGSVTTAGGVRIEAQGASGISGTYGVQQKGAGDPNWFAGATTFGAQTNTPLTNIQVYSPSLTPGSVAAATVAEQTFTVTGLTTADKVMVNPPAIANATGIAGARVSAANTLAIRFTNPTAGALTPSSGTYTVIAIRS